MFKLSKLIVTSMFTVLLTFPLTTKAEDHPLIGINHPPLPEEIEGMGGWLIEEPYTVKQVSMDGQESLLLSRVIERDAQGNPLFQVVNVLALPPIDVKKEILRGFMCQVNGKEDPNVIVVMKLEDTPYLTKARKAWRVENEQFNEIDVASLQFQCENFGYGL